MRRLVLAYALLALSLFGTAPALSQGVNGFDPVTPPVPVVTMQDVSVPAGSPFSQSAAATLFSIETSGFNSIALQLSGTWAGTVAYEASNDGVNWVSVAGYDPSNTGTAAPSISNTSPTIKLFAVVARYFRARVSTYTSGTVVAAPVLRSTPLAPLGINIGAGTVNAVASASSGALGSTSSAVKAAASTNATLLKATAGNLYDYMLCNAAASTRAVKFFNKTSAPVVGTDVPFFKLSISAGACIAGNFSTPVRFAAGIGYAITGAIGDLDTTATAADDVTGIINWM